MGEANHEPIASLLDSPNWLPFEQIHRRLCPSIGERGLAARDMTDAFEDGSIRTLRRWLAARGAAKPRLNDSRLWAVKFELSSWSDGLYVAYRLHGKARHYPQQIRFLKGYVFYAWLPDLAKVWPSIFGSMLPPAAPTGAVAVVEGQDTIAGTGIVERPEITGTLAVIEGQDDITAAGTAVSEPSSTTPVSVKRLVYQHPRHSGEKARDYFDRLEDLSGREYPRKTLRNRYYEIQKEKR